MADELKPKGVDPHDLAAATISAQSLVHAVAIERDGVIIATALVRPVHDPASAEACGAAIEAAVAEALARSPA